MKTKMSALQGAIFGVSLAFAMTTNAAVMQDDAVQIATSTKSTKNIKQITSKRFIVKFKQTQLLPQLALNNTSMSIAATRTAGIGMKHVRQMATGAHVFEMDINLGQEQISEALLKLNSNPIIEEIVEDKFMQIMATPSDPNYNQQWHYYESTGGLNLPTAWDSSTGAGVVVAVIDTGYTSHSDLNANLLPGYDMISSASIANDGNGRDSDARDTGDATAANECNDGRGARRSSWHGTHVAGTVAAVTNNGRGIAGVAYNAKVVPIRALGKCGGRTSDIADGIIWAAGGSVPGVPSNPNPAKVINLSLGGAGACGSQTQAAINRAVSLGATVVVAAGNSNRNASNATPANCSNVVTVAAVGRNGGRASYSNFGSVVDIAAPGGDQRTGASDGVLSTINSGTGAPAGESYAYYQGTSMATPHVAGAVALMYSLDSSLTPAGVESILKSTARSFPATCNSCGRGIVDAAAAVAAVGGTTPPPPSGGAAPSIDVSNISGSRNTWKEGTLEVPAGQSRLVVRMSGGSGDADLYVRFGSSPSTSSYDCRPFLSGNNETCTINNPRAGTWYIRIRGYTNYSGVRLQASSQ